MEACDERGAVARREVSWKPEEQQTEPQCAAASTERSKVQEEGQVCGDTRQHRREARNLKIQRRGGEKWR